MNWTQDVPTKPGNYVVVYHDMVWGAALLVVEGGELKEAWSGHAYPLACLTPDVAWWSGPHDGPSEASAPDTIADGHGSAWSIVCPDCGKRTMHVVRPGKVQCGECG